MDAWIVFLGLGCVFLGVFAYMFMTHFKKGSPDPLKLQDKYSPEMNRFAAQRETSAAKARTALLNRLGEEINSVSILEQRKIDHEISPLIHQREMENSYHEVQLHRVERDEQHKTFLRAQENQRIVIDEASNQRLSPMVYEALVVERNKIAAELERKRLLDQLDVEKERAMAKVELEMVDRARLAPYQELELIRLRIDQLYSESEEVWKSNLPDTLKTRRIELLEKTIKFLEETYYARQGLLQIGDGQNVQGAHEEADSPRDSSEAV